MGGKQSRAIERNIREVIEQQLSPIRNQVSSTKTSLTTSINEVETLKQQLSICQKTIQVMEMQLHKTMEFGKQLDSTNAKVASTNARLKSSKEEVDKLKQQIASREKGQQEIGRKLHRMIELENRVQSCMIECLSSKSSLEVLNMDVNGLREKVISYDKFNEGMKMKFDKVMELETQLCYIDSKVVETKSRLKACKKDEEGLQNELLVQENLELDMEIKLHKVLELEKQLLCVLTRTILNKDCFEALKKKEDVLRRELLDCEKFHKGMELKVNKIVRLEKEISCTSCEVIFAKESIECLKNEEMVLKEQVLAQEMVQ